MPSKINKSSKGLFGGLIPQKSAATSKRSPGTVESKSPLISQKVGPKEGSSHQLKPDNLLVAGARRKVALAMGDVGGDDLDGGAASVHDASLPVKALVYTEAFQSEKKMGDLDDDALSSATGTTVRGRGSPCSIADISSLESVPSPLLATTGGREGEATKGKSLTMSKHKTCVHMYVRTYVQYVYKYLCMQDMCTYVHMYIYAHARTVRV